MTCSPKIIIYADDTNNFFTSNNLTPHQSSVNDYMRRLPNWLKDNRLELSAKKTHVHHISSYNKPLSTTFTVMLNNQLLENVREQKFLGVWFQKKLSWTAHVEHLWIELARTIRILYKLTTLIPFWLKKTCLPVFVLFEALLWNISLRNDDTRQL